MPGQVRTCERNPRASTHRELPRAPILREAIALRNAAGIEVINRSSRTARKTARRPAAEADAKGTKNHHASRERPAEVASYFSASSPRPSELGLPRTTLRVPSRLRSAGNLVRTIMGVAALWRSGTGCSRGSCATNVVTPVPMSRPCQTTSPLPNKSDFPKPGLLQQTPK
jgi:hypothetical protein